MVRNLRELRESAGLSQSELADLIGISQAQVSRYEADPDQVPLKVFNDWVVTCGGQAVDLNVLLSSQMPSQAERGSGGLFVAPNRTPLEQELGLVRRYAKSPPPEVAQHELGTRLVRQLNGLVAANIERPTVYLGGNFDAGKSRIGNELLGDRYLPSRYRPTTKVLCWVMHQDQRPHFRRKSLYSAYFFRAGFKLDRMHDESHWVDHELHAASFAELVDHATHFGSRDLPVASVIFFVDTPILRCCHLLDTPGLDFQKDDELQASGAVGHADVLLYLSSFNQFMGASEVAWLSQAIDQLPVIPPGDGEDPQAAILANIFVLATHAHPSISSDPDLIAEFRKYAAETLHLELGECLARRAARIGVKSPGLEAVQSRIFAYWAETPGLRLPFETDLRGLLERTLPRWARRKADDQADALKGQARTLYDAEIGALGAVLDDLIRSRAEYDNLMACEGDRRRTRRKRNREVVARIKSLRDESLEAMRSVYDAHANRNFVEALIRERYGDDKKRAKEYAANALKEQINARIAEKLEPLEKQLTAEIESYLGEFVKFDTKISEVLKITFDPIVEFAIALDEAIGSGMLAGLGATAGILAKVGVAAAVLAGAAGAAAVALGFVTFLAVWTAVVIVGVLAAVGAFIWGSGSWQGRLADKIVDLYEKRGVKRELEQGITEYWALTLKAYEYASAKVEERFADYLKKLGAVVNDKKGGPAAIEEKLARLRRAREWFLSIPWVRDQAD